MSVLPMNMPAEIHRWVESGDARGNGATDVVVARGPLVIMAHGLLAIDPNGRAGCWISSALGKLTPRDAREALEHWSTPHEII